MKELFKAVIAIHKGFTMTGYEWEPEWTSIYSVCVQPDQTKNNQRIRIP